jgi:hypothetical protein
VPKFSLYISYVSPVLHRVNARDAPTPRLIYIKSFPVSFVIKFNLPNLLVTYPAKAVPGQNIAVVIIDGPDLPEISRPLRSRLRYYNKEACSIRLREMFLFFTLKS